MNEWNDWGLRVDDVSRLVVARALYEKISRTVPGVGSYR
jgi:hypothetical protein